jgi:hypothetical protein
MKKLMSILGAALFVFALTLSSCGEDAVVAHGEEGHECADKDKKDAKSKCFVAPVVEEEVVEEEVVVEEEEVVVEEVSE